MREGVEMELARFDQETRTTFLLPITLAEIEAAGVELEGSFGLDVTEHQAMREEEGLVRIAFGVEVDDALEVGRFAHVECLQGRLHRPAAEWEYAMRIYQHPAGYKAAAQARRNVTRLFALLEAQVPSLEVLLTAAEAPHLAWARELDAELNRSCPEEEGI